MLSLFSLKSVGEKEKEPTIAAYRCYRECVGVRCHFTKPSAQEFNYTGRPS